MYVNFTFLIISITQNQLLSEFVILNNQFML